MIVTIAWALFHFILYSPNQWANYRIAFCWCRMADRSDIKASRLRLGIVQSMYSHSKKQHHNLSPPTPSLSLQVIVLCHNSAKHLQVPSKTRATNTKTQRKEKKWDILAQEKSKELKIMTWQKPSQSAWQMFHTTTFHTEWKKVLWYKKQFIYKMQAIEPKEHIYFFTIMLYTLETLLFHILRTAKANFLFDISLKCPTLPEHVLAQAHIYMGCVKSVLFSIIVFLFSQRLFWHQNCIYFFHEPKGCFILWSFPMRTLGEGFLCVHFANWHIIHLPNTPTHLNCCIVIYLGQKSYTQSLHSQYSGITLFNHHYEINRMSFN